MSSTTPSRARVGAANALFDGDGRGESFDKIDVGLLQLLEELTGISGQAFDVFALALGVDCIERETRLAGAAEAGDNGQLVARNGERDVLEVVLPGTADGDIIAWHLAEICSFWNRQE